MQKLKNDIRRELLKSAEELFLRKGFQKTSMREIAETAQVGLGNIYNYFSGKDDLFCSIVYPVTHAFERMLEKHHGHYGADVMEILSEVYLREAVDEYIVLIRRYRELMILLLFRAQGSSLANFRESFTDRSTELVKEWFSEMKYRYPVLNVTVSDFFIHLHSVWMFTLFEEIIMHKIEDQEIEQIVAAYVKFEITGWRDILKI